MSGEEVKKILTENGYKLTDIGSILYEEWGGIKSDLSIYQLEKEKWKVYVYF